MPPLARSLPHSSSLPPLYLVARMSKCEMGMGKNEKATRWEEELVIACNDGKKIEFLYLTNNLL